MDRWAPVIIIGAVVFGWLYRYDISAISGLDRPHGVYVLDRWTGGVQYCQGRQCVDIGSDTVPAR